jgi:hypothetical protein
MAFSLKNIVLLLLASFASAQFIQLSSTKNQVLGALGSGTVLTYDSIDAVSGLKFTSGTGVIEVPPGANGTYFIIAAPQVGCNGCGGFLSRTGFTADFWVAQNGAAVANSNVRLIGSKTTKDVIVTQGLIVLAPGDKISILGSGSKAVCEAITQAGEPLIPSVILTIYKI